MSDTNDNPEPSRELVITSLAYGGEGVARHDGKVVFVEGALPGETVTASTLEARARFERAALSSVLQAAPERRSPDCPHEAEGCGGCGFRHVADAHSLPLKAASARSAVERIARSVEWPEFALHPAASLDHSRRRLRLHNDAEGRVGLYKRGSHDLVSIGSCRAVVPSLLAALPRLEDMLRAAHTEQRPATLLVEQVAKGLALEWSGSLGPLQRQGLTVLVEEGVFVGVRVRQRGRIEHLGTGWVQEPPVVAGGVSLRRRIGAFSQATAEGNASLHRAVREWTAEITPSHLLELYAGSGNLTLAAYPACEAVTAVEIEGPALESLRRNIQDLSLDRVRAYERDLRRGFTNRMRTTPVDAVLLDPPRAGAKEVIDGVLGLKPREILYVSCSPPHMARDVERLAGNYRVVSVGAIDLFPRTPQLELVVRLARRK